MNRITGRSLEKLIATSCVVIAVVLGAAQNGLAQAPVPFAITDNSFLVKKPLTRTRASFRTS